MKHLIILSTLAMTGCAPVESMVADSEVERKRCVSRMGSPANIQIPVGCQPVQQAKN